MEKLKHPPKRAREKRVKFRPAEETEGRKWDVSAFHRRTKRDSSIADYYLRARLLGSVHVSSLAFSRFSSSLCLLMNFALPVISLRVLIFVLSFFPLNIQDSRSPVRRSPSPRVLLIFRHWMSTRMYVNLFCRCFILYVALWNFDNFDVFIFRECFARYWKINHLQLERVESL